MPEEINKTPAEQITPIPPQETSVAVQALNPAMDSWKLACSMGKPMHSFLTVWFPRATRETLPPARSPATWPPEWAWIRRL